MILIKKIEPRILYVSTHSESWELRPRVLPELGEISGK